jgi:hypothetical protein
MLSFKSSKVGSGLDRVITLFILEASSYQFEIPTVATFGGSNKLWSTLRGLCGDISANPISSIITKTLVFPS